MTVDVARWADAAIVDVAQLAGLAAAVLSGVFSLVQVVHIARARSTGGLSAGSWLLLCLTFAAWLTFGVIQRDPYLIPTNASALAGALWVVWRIHRSQRIQGRQLLVTAAAVLSAFVLQLTGGVIGALVAVFSITAVIRARQGRSVRRASDVAGVALGPWIVSSTAQVLWFVHAVPSGKLVVATHAPFAIATNVALMATVVRRRRDINRPSSANSVGDGWR
jgi:uncharacterized protein with PQ loop repeat